MASEEKGSCELGSKRSICSSRIAAVDEGGGLNDWNFWNDCRVLLPRLHLVTEHLRFGKLRLA
jgi:hypothetical protein